MTKQLLAGAALAIFLYLTSLYAVGLFYATVTILLIGLVFWNLAVVRKLRREVAAHPDIITLNARYRTQLALFIAALVSALLASAPIIRYFGGLPQLSREFYLTGLAFALITISFPALDWTFTVWKPWKRDE